MKKRSFNYIGKDFYGTISDLKIFAGILTNN